METKINITTILKDKPKGTKLYSTVHGECTFETITDEIFKINFCTSKFGLTQTGECVLIKFGNMFDGGECIVFPSKEMRDWSKFAWKKGDILVNANNTHVIFEKFENDTYTTFVGRHIIGKHYFDDDDKSGYTYIPKGFTLDTKQFSIEKGDAIQTYISNVEKEIGGKLNLKTLEVEKEQPEFKDGDIVFMKEIKGGYFVNRIFILKGEYKDGDEIAFYYAFYNADYKITTTEHGYTRVYYSLRLATDSEKQQLFDALAKKGKRWDSKRKQIVDLKPKVEFKPFDKVLVRDSKASKWRANLFSHKNIDEPYYCVYASWNYCIPYEGNEHLLGTKNNPK